MTPRRLALVAAFAVALSAATPASAHRTFPTCNTFEPRPNPDSSCFQGNPWGAVFVASSADNVEYKVCVREPAGDRDCYRKTSGAAGEPSVARLFREGPGNLRDEAGTYVLKWYRRGEQIDRDRLLLHPEML